MNCTEAQWDLVRKHLEPAQAKGDPRGRPMQDLRAVFNAVLWICKTGARWKDLPKEYPPYQTCHRHFQRWCTGGAWHQVLWDLALDLKRRGGVDITECFIDGTFSSAKKGGVILDRLREARAPRSWSSQTLLVFLSPYGPSEQAPMK
jgi:transposase